MAARTRALLYLTLIFTCGMVAGALAMNVVEHGWLHRGIPYVRTSRISNEARAHILEQVKKELVLTPAQAGQLETIVDDTMKQFEDLHEQAHRVRLESRERIRSILDDQQKVKFEEAMAKLQKRFGVPE